MNLSWCYLSAATPAFDVGRLDELYRSAREFNAARQISGVLLYGHGRFCQMIEGPEAGMREVIARVHDSALHADLLTLHQEPVAVPAFASWSLGTASDWRGQRTSSAGSTLDTLTPAQQAACRVLRHLIDGEDADATQDFTPIRY